MELVRVQEKKIFKKAIEDAGLSFSDFDEKDATLMYTLKLRNTPFFITFIQDPNHFAFFNVNLVRYKPKFPTTTIRQSKSIVGQKPGFAPLNKVMIWMNDWLVKDVKPYIAHQIEEKEWYDKKSVNQEYSSLNISTDVSEMFDDKQQEQISIKLEEWKSEISKLIQANTEITNEAKAEQTKQLNQLTEYLKQESKTQTRFAWVGLALGAYQIFQPYIGIDATTVAQYFLNIVVKSLPALNSINPINLIGQ